MSSFSYHANLQIIPSLSKKIRFSNIFSLKCLFCIFFVNFATMQKIFNITGTIGEDVNPIELAAFLNENAGTPVEIVIDSMGGYVSDGFKMAELIEAHGQVTTIARNVGSAANLPFLAGAQRVVMNPGSSFKIHNSRIKVEGNSDELRKQAEELDRIDIDMAEYYARRTNKEPEFYAQFMRTPTALDYAQFGAEAALKMGFATTIKELRAVALIHTEKITSNLNPEEKMEKKSLISALSDLFKTHNIPVNEVQGMEIELEKETEKPTEEMPEWAKMLLEKLQGFESEMSAMKNELALCKKETAEVTDTVVASVEKVLKGAKINASLPKVDKVAEEKAPKKSLTQIFNESQQNYIPTIR